MSIAAVEAGSSDRGGQAVHSSVRRHPISQSTKRLKALQLGADGLGLAMAFGTMYMYLYRQAESGGGFDRGRGQLLFCAVCIPMCLVVFRHYRLYAARTTANRMEECSRLLHAIAVSAGLMAILSYVIRLDTSRSLVLGGAVLALPVCLLEREVMRAFFRTLRTSGRLCRRAVIIGSNEEAQVIAQMFQGTPHLGYEVVGLCSDVLTEESSVPWLGRLADVADAVAAAGASTAVVATTSLGPTEVNAVVRRLHDAGVHIELTAGLRDIPADRLSVRDLGRHAVFYLEPTVHHGWRAVAKRAFDLAVSIPTLLLISPVMAVCALAIKLTSPGPVHFHQERIGKEGVPFRIHKLRTMVIDAESMVVGLAERNEADGPLFKLRDDPRLTKVGRVLRKLSLDEVPQLWNVVRGEMSLVGPRPAMLHEISGWTAELHNRLRVKPGVTGMWQVSGRSNASFDDYVRYDLFYVDNWSLTRDLAIFAKTIPTVVLRRGAC